MALAIPTFNSSSLLSELLREDYVHFLRNSCDIFIYDSSDDNSTLQMLKACDYSDVNYVSLDSSVKSNEKVYMIYRDLANQYEYIWMNRDATWFDRDLIDYLMGVIKKDEPDILYMEDVKDTDFFKMTFRNVSKFFLQANAGMTFYGSTIIKSSTVLKNVDWDYFNKKYLYSATHNFSHVGLQIEQLLSLSSFKGICVEFPKGLRHLTKITSTWYPDIIRIWSECWVSLIDGIRKLHAINEETLNMILFSPPQRFTDERLVLFRALGWYDLKQYGLYKEWMSRVSNVSQDRMRDIAAMSQSEAHAECRNHIKTRIKKSIGNFSKIYIYGAGQVGKRFAMDFDRVGVPFEGFIVTEKDGLEEIDGHKIYKISECSFDDNTGIVLGLGRINKKEVIELLINSNLERNLCDDYTAADFRYNFLFDKDVDKDGF